jgi:uncharacterized protein (TIGR02246 family)
MTVGCVGLVALLLSLPVLAFGGPAEDANAVIDQWAALFTANDASALVQLYSADAVVLGTVSPTIAQGTEAIRAYFSRLPGSGSKVVIGERRTIVVNDAAVTSAGFYDFTLMRDGQSVPNPARFTFLVIKRDGRWLIAHHHSSFRPKPPQ